MSAADSVISGVVRGVLPYAAVGVAGFIGYRWLKKRGVFKDLNRIVDDASKIPTKIVDFAKEKTALKGIEQIQDGDWIGGAQTIIRRTTPIGIVEHVLTGGGDSNFENIPNIPDLLPDDPPAIVEEAVTKSDDSIWRDTPLKYVPAVAVRNGILGWLGK